MANATVFQSAQWGLEVTPGTNVAADTKIDAFGVSFTPSGGEAEVFRPEGMKFATGVIPAADELTDLAIEGKLDYNCIVYLLASLINYAAPAQQAATVAYLWTFTPDSDGPDTKKTYSLEKGSSITAAEVSYGLITGLTLTFNRTGITLSGTGIAYRQADGISLTGAPDEIAIEWCLPANVNVYLEDTQAALAGGSALTTLKEVEWHLTGKYGADWNLVAAQTSFNDTVELPSDHGGYIQVTKDSDAEALRTKARAGDIKWLKISVDGDNIEDTYDYGFDLTVPLKFTSPGEEADQDGVYAMTFPFSAVHDSTWGKSLEILVMNIVDTL